MKSEWMPMDSAPFESILAFGYELTPYSREREMLSTAIIYRRTDGDWCKEDGTLFEPLGWVSIPDFIHPDKYNPPSQKSASGSPKFSVGDRVYFHSRYDGIVVRTIVSVIGWPSGWWYELDEIEHVGHGNPSIGHKRLQWCNGLVCGRPARESELIEIVDEG